MAEVKLPLVGGVSKKALAIGGAASAAVVAFIYIRKRNAQNASAATTATGDTTGTDTTGTGDYVDPGLQDTGLGPTYGATGYYDPNTGQWVYGSTGTGQAAAATNAQWAQMAEQYLTANNGADPSALSAALGAYLAGQAVTSDQVSLIDQAIAVEGYPPVAGPSGYPPGIREGGTPSQGGTGGSGGGVTGSGSGSGSDGSGSGSGSGTTGSPPQGPGRLSAPSGVHLTGRGKTGVQLQWNAVSGARGYVCQAKKGGANGPVVNGPFSVTRTLCNFGDLQPNTHYTALIWPSSENDLGGPGSKQPHTEFGFSTTK